jgi:hypothetical protein
MKFLWHDILALIGAKDQAGVGHQVNIAQQSKTGK